MYGRGALGWALLCLPTGLAVAWLAYGVYRTSSWSFSSLPSSFLSSKVNSSEKRSRGEDSAVQCPVCPEAAECPKVIPCDARTDNYLPVTPLPETNYDEEGGRLLLHSWFEGPKLFPGYEYLFTGYLASQNLAKTKFVQWITEDWLSSDDQRKVYLVQKYRFHPNIEFRMFVKEDLVKGTCWEDRPEFMEKTTILKYGMRDYSNVVRWLLLYNFGGIWLDADTIPLADLTVLHEMNADWLVAGYAPPGKKNFTKEEGMFNNNLLHVTNRSVRNKIMEVACEFRRKPVPEEEMLSNREPFVNVIPLVGEDKHELYVMNHWLFNDGTLRYCWIRDDCKIRPIDLGSTDPIWVRTNDMYAICERMIQSMERYTAKFTDLIKARTAGTYRDYLFANGNDDNVWVVHNRLSHCRTANTVPLGMSKWFGTLADSAIGPDPLKAPSEAQNLLTMDKYEIKRSNWEIDFIPLIIVMESQFDKLADRQMLRGLINNKEWFPEIFDSMSRHFKLFFVVPYHTHPKAHDWNAKLHAELYEFDDLILVDPGATTLEKVKTPPQISPVLRLGVLKILNVHECRFMMFLFRPNIFVHMRNLFYLLNVASGRVLFNKEHGVDSFVITSKLPSIEEEREAQALVGEEDQTIFRPVARTQQPQPFVIFTRNNLRVMLNFPSNDLNGTEGATDDGFEPTYVLPPSTQKEVIDRVVPWKGKMPTVYPEGLEATTLESYRFWGAPMGASSLHTFLDLFRPVLQSIPSCGSLLSPDYSYEAPALPPDAAEEIRSAMLPMNVTVIWDIPCKAAAWQLFSASESIPFLLVK